MTSRGAPALLAQKVDAAVINAGDGTHEHPTQALLDALTIRRRRGTLQGLTIAICGDIAHSRVARSNIYLLTTMGAAVRLIGPPTLMPPGIDRLGIDVFHNMDEGLAGVDIVMMLRLQRERMTRGQVPSAREYFRFYGLDAARLARAKPDALVMHPGPMNRGVEIDSAVADDPARSLIREQVEMGVAVRMAVPGYARAQARREVFRQERPSFLKKRSKRLSSTYGARWGGVSFQQSATAQTKAFCFFFSKKKDFLPSLVTHHA